MKYKYIEVKQEEIKDDKFTIEEFAGNKTVTVHPYSIEISGDISFRVTKKNVIRISRILHRPDHDHNDEVWLCIINGELRWETWNVAKEHFVEIPLEPEAWREHD